MQVERPEPEPEHELGGRLIDDRIQMEVECDTGEWYRNVY